MTTTRAWKPKKPEVVTATPLCPAWVFRRLLLEGIGDPRAEDRRRLSPSASIPRWCVKCGQPVFEGRCWPDPHVVVDVTPTTPDCELVAVLQGRRSFHRDIHRVLEGRRNRIRYLTANEERVYLEHHCGAMHPVPNEKWKPKEIRNDDPMPF